ncbi:hypothetical protein F4861DRAFT_523922 [Xylaria intraflava]|nr:hypothetical protein F4861DRAFT_523922 [Xylaria intraflava]
MADFLRSTVASAYILSWLLECFGLDLWDSADVQCTWYYAPGLANQVHIVCCLALSWGSLTAVLASQALVGSFWIVMSCHVMPGLCGM